MRFNTSLLFTTLLVVTNNIVFASRSFKDKKIYFLQKYHLKNAAITAFKYYQAEQKKIQQARTAKYNPNNNTMPESLISKINNVQPRKDINFSIF